MFNSTSSSSSSTPSKYVIPAHRSSKAGRSSKAELTSDYPKSSKASRSSDGDAFIPRGRSGLVLAQKDVSPSFVRKADASVMTFPEGLQNHFRKNACEVKLAKTLDKVFPHLNEEPEMVDTSHNPRTWRTAPGVTYDRTVGIPEFTTLPKSGKLSHQCDFDAKLNIIKHELGHALINTTNLLFTETGLNHDFEDAYKKDLAAMRPIVAERLKYYIPTNSNYRGHEELCAEILAALYGGGCRDAETMKKAFPRTTAYMSKALDKLVKQNEK